MKVVRTVVFVVALIVFIGSAIYLGKYYYTSYKESHAFEGLKTNNEHDLVALHAKNNDLVGWIKIEGTNIDYPVVQTPDEPEFYLRKDFEGKHSVAGTPFMDANSKIGETKNYLIYGHNIKAGTMFHDLLEYEDKKFWEKHPTFTYDEYRDGKQVNGTYKVIAFFRSSIKEEGSSEFKYYTYPNIFDEDMYNEYVQGIKSIAAFDTGVEANWPDQLVTLSTCAYHTDDGRFAVVGVKISED